MHGTEFHEARREWSHPQGSPSSSRLNATRWGRQSKEIIIRSTGAIYWITTYQKFYYFIGSSSHTLQTTSEDRSVIFILQMRKLRHNELKQHLSWVTHLVGEPNLNPDLYDSRAVVFFIILCCLCKEGATEIETLSILPDTILGLLNFNGLALQMFNPRPLSLHLFLSHWSQSGRQSAAPLQLTV